MNGFRTENDELARRAGAFAGLSERARGIVDQLNDSLGGYGDCWGSDAVGRSFAETHVGPAEAALQGIGALPGGLFDVGIKLGDTAATYADAEQTSTGIVRDAGRPLE
jgi:uncharacterized protein YukE